MTAPSTFYDEHPFDWIERYGADELDGTLSPLLRRTLDQTPKDSFVVDIGCGPGRVTSALVRRGLACAGLDKSVVSLGLMRRRTGSPGIAGDNLDLPLRDGAADLVVSDGVIHHTPDPRRSFAETCRVVREGGRLYLAVYKPTGRYSLLYRFPGGFIRRADTTLLGRAIVYPVFLLPYYLLHQIRSRGRRTWRGVRNLFYDYFITPQVVFLSRAEIEGWCGECGMAVVVYDPNPRENVHCFLLEKRAADLSL